MKKGIVLPDFSEETEEEGCFGCIVSSATCIITGLLLAVLAFMFTSCSSIGRMMSPGPAHAPRNVSGGPMGAPMGTAYDEFDVMRYGIMKREMESMNRSR